MADREPDRALGAQEGDRWRTAWTAALLALVLLPVFVPIVPRLLWAGDPRSPGGDAAVALLGPVGFAWWCALVLAAAAGGLAAHARAGGRLRWVESLVLLAAMGVTAFHMSAGFDQLFRGCGWLAALGAAAALLHLAEHAPARRLIVACLAAAALPMAIEAVLYVFVEHPMVVRHYQAREAQVIESQGWDMGSPQHLLYRRRLLTAEAAGAVGMSNVFGSIAAAAAVAAGAVGVFWAWRRSWRIAAAPGALALLGVAAAAMSRSKGAAGALLLAAGLVALAGWWRGRRKGYLSAAVAVGLVAAVVLGVIGRGLAGPPASVEGERSLLFRYHYWQGALGVVADQPAVGVGPAGFQRAYVQHKPAINPEEVASAHNALVDWAAMLGVAGWALAGLVVVWLWRAGRSVARERGDEASAGGGDMLTLGPHELAWPGAVAAVVFGSQLLVTHAELLPETLLAVVIGAMGFAVVAGYLMKASWQPAWVGRLALLGAVAVLLIQGQIEMTYFHYSSAALALGVTAAAGAWDGSGKLRLQSPAGYGGAAAFGAAALAVVVLAAVPLTRRQGVLQEAGQRVRAGRLAEAAGALKRAQALAPPDAELYRWRAQLFAEQAAAAQAAGERAAARAAVERSLGVLAEAQAHGLEEAKLLRMAAQVHQLRQRWGEPGALGEAIAAMRAVVEINPQSLQDQMRLADLLWESGDRAAAAGAYQRALWLSARAYLDPAKQLSAEDAQRAQERGGL